MFPSLGISLLILLQIASISSAGELADTTKADPMASSSNVPPIVDIPPSSAREDTEAPAIPSSTNEPLSVDIPASPAREDTDMMIVEAPKIPSSLNDPLTTDIPPSSAREDTDMILAEAPAMPSTTNKRPSVDIASSSAREDADMMIVEAPNIPSPSNDPLTTDIPPSSAQENTNMAIVAVPEIPSSSEPPMSDILPLVLIRVFSADYTINPTRFKRIRWLKTKKDKVLAGSTRFSVRKGIEVVRQIYMCDMGTFKNFYKPSKIVHDDRYCTYRTRFGNKEALRCKFEPVPFVEKVNISRDPKKEQLDLSCGANEHSKMYHFVYKACFTEKAIKNEDILKNNFSTLRNFNPITNRDSIEIYRFCYNEKDEDIIYTTHRLGSARLLFHDSLKQERAKTFQMMSGGYDYFGSHFQEMEKDYDELEKNEINSPYQAQKLTPHEDFEFALWRKTTYHYVNVKPMQRRQANLWNFIGLLIREDAKKNRRSYDIHTGVFTLPENREKLPILGKINSPDIWLKFIEYTYTIPKNNDEVAHDGIVIIMNANYGNSHTDTYFSEICEKNWCEKSLRDIFPEYEVELKTVGCCPANEEILKFFNTTVTIRNLLEIDSLTDERENAADKIDISERLENETERPFKKAKHFIQ